MKYKRTAVLLSILLVVSFSAFFIYKLSYHNEINYVAIGDSVSRGRNPYGVDDYGYTDYVKDYLLSHNKLSSYLNYSVSGYTTKNIVDDINLNVSIDSVSIRRALRESDLVTITIGANDFLNGITLSNLEWFLNDEKAIFERIDNVFINVSKTLSLIKKYAKNQIILIGYYNPLPKLDEYSSLINKLVDYSDTKYQKLCNEYNIDFIKISDIFKANTDYLPNPFDIHPNKNGYAAISKRVISTIENN